MRLIKEWKRHKKCDVHGISPVCEEESMDGRIFLVFSLEGNAEELMENSLSQMYLNKISGPNKYSSILLAELLCLPYTFNSAVARPSSVSRSRGN